jgi:hypothetical protein
MSKAPPLADSLLLQAPRRNPVMIENAPKDRTGSLGRMPFAGADMCGFVLVRSLI